MEYICTKPRGFRPPILGVRPIRPTDFCLRYGRSRPVQYKFGTYSTTQADCSHESHVSVTAMDARNKEQEWVRFHVRSERVARATCEQLNDGGEAMTEARRGND